jgi:hypothetical protein
VDVLQHAWALAKANQGAPGVDGESFEDIESKGLTEWLNGLGKELHDKKKRVRHFLRRRHKVSTQGTREYSQERIYGELGVFRLQGPLREARS